MRSELEHIAQIEQYLCGSLSAGDRIAFEHQLAGNPTLQESVSLQQQLMKGLMRLSLTGQVRRSYNSYKQWQRLKFSVATGLITIAAIVAVISYTRSRHAAQTHTTEPVTTSARQQPAGDTPPQKNNGLVATGTTHRAAPAAGSIARPACEQGDTTPTVMHPKNIHAHKATPRQKRSKKTKKHAAASATGDTTPAAVPQKTKHTHKTMPRAKRYKTVGPSHTLPLKQESGSATTSSI